MNIEVLYPKKNFYAPKTNFWLRPWYRPFFSVWISPRQHAAVLVKTCSQQCEVCWQRATMAEKCDVSKIVTTFLLNTCRLPPRISKDDIQAAATCAEIATLYSPDDNDASFIPLISGSVAEFYIEPMIQLFGDIDVMHHWNTQLAIPRGHPPPTQLPTEFHNYV